MTPSLDPFLRAQISVNSDKIEIAPSVPKQVSEQSVIALKLYLNSQVTMKALVVKNCLFSDDLWALFLSTLGAMPPLTRLAFADCHLSETQLASLSMTVVKQHARKLQRFGLSGNPISPFPWKTFDLIQRCSGIVKLKLSENNFGPNDIASLRKQMRFHDLTRLNLSGNPLGDAGAKEVARTLENGASLARLNLSQCAIGDEGIDYLTLACKNFLDFQRCRLVGNQFSQLGLSYIAKRFEKLELLDVSENSKVVNCLKIFKLFYRVVPTEIVVKMTGMPLTQNQVDKTTRKCEPEKFNRRATLLFSKKMIEVKSLISLQERYRSSQVQIACIENYKKLRKPPLTEPLAKKARPKPPSIDPPPSFFRDLAVEVEGLDAIDGNIFIAAPGKEQRELKPYEKELKPLLEKALEHTPGLLQQVMAAPSEMEKDLLFLEFLSIKFRIITMPEDGLCLYHSLVYGVPEIFQSVDQTLTLLADQMLSNWELYGPFLSEKEAQGTPQERVSKFCEGLKRGDHWGDHLALQACVGVLQTFVIDRPIWIFDVSAPGEVKKGILIPPEHHLFGEGTGKPLILHRSHYLPNTEKKIEHYCVLEQKI